MDLHLAPAAGGLELKSPAQCLINTNPHIIPLTPYGRGHLLLTREATEASGWEGPLDAKFGDNE